MRTLTLSILLLFSILSFEMLKAQTKTTTMGNCQYSTYRDKPIEKYAEHPCSPKNPGPEWIGIKINVPDKVEVNLDDEIKIIPLFGLYQISTAALIRNKDAIKICLKNIDTDIGFTGYVIEKEDGHPIDPPDENPYTEEEIKELEDYVSSSYFNPNISEYVQFPVVPGKYEVYIEYGGNKSNIEYFEVLFRK